MTYPRPHYDAQLKERVGMLLDVTTSNQAIAKQLRISVDTVRRYRRNKRPFGIVERPMRGRNGRPVKIHTAAGEALQ